MYRADSRNLRLTEDEYIAVREVLDNSLSVIAAQWPARFVILSGDQRTLDAVVAVLLDQGFQHHA